MLVFLHVGSFWSSEQTNNLNLGVQGTDHSAKKSQKIGHLFPEKIKSDDKITLAVAGSNANKKGVDTFL